MVELRELELRLAAHEAARKAEVARVKHEQKVLGRMLRVARRARGVGQSEVAREIKRSKYVLSNIELGRGWSTPIVEATIKVLRKREVQRG